MALLSGVSGDTGAQTEGLLPKSIHPGADRQQLHGLVTPAGMQILTIAGTGGGGMSQSEPAAVLAVIRLCHGGGEVATGKHAALDCSAAANLESQVLETHSVGLPPGTPA